MGCDVVIFGMALVREGEISKFFRWGLWEKQSWAGKRGAKRVLSQVALCCLLRPD